ncbi:hypothetical protein [Vibrio vulnificus YJ016]|uniref:Uncharacterized protein n=1 Tax=Vibrio vulnificus (strain YJ016) TaxID=196600 RepID=Q7MLW8_VIBVY|nr:hypothetical protein [Vibrio vulnificus YJ016]
MIQRNLLDTYKYQFQGRYTDAIHKSKSRYISRFVCFEFSDIRTISA